MVSGKHISIYNKVKSTIEADKLYLRSDISLAMLSRIVGTNTVYLSQAVNEGYGCNFSTMINRYRVNHIIEEASRSSQRIEIVAAKYDFWSRSTFYDAFRQVTGMTPRRYMNKLKIDKDESKEIQSLTN